MEVGMAWLKRVWTWLVITHFGILSLVIMFAGAGVITWGIVGEPKWLFPIGLVIFLAGIVWMTADAKSDAVTPPAPVGPGETPVEPNVPTGEIDSPPYAPTEDGGPGGELYRGDNR
jgi:hypothetical protein